MIAATVLASLLTPVVRRTSAFQELRRSLPVDRARDLTLHLVLNSLTRSGTAFDPAFRVEGGDALESALGSRRGVLMCATHTVALALVPRLLHDTRPDATIVTAESWIRVPGTRAMFSTLRPSRMFLLELRTRLRDGGLVCAMIDRSQEELSRTVEIATAEGRLRVSDALIRVAVKCGARVVFVAACLEPSGGVVVRFGEPAEPDPSEERITEDFVAFVQAHVAQVAASRPGHPGGAPAPRD